MAKGHDLGVTTRPWSWPQLGILKHMKNMQFSICITSNLSINRLNHLIGLPSRLPSHIWTNSKKVYLENPRSDYVLIMIHFFDEMLRENKVIRRVDEKRGYYQLVLLGAKWNHVLLILRVVLQGGKNTGHQYSREQKLT